MQIKTESGFNFEIDYEQIADDWEVVEMLVNIDADGVAQHPAEMVKVAIRIMGEEQFAAFKKYLKEKNGRVSTQVVLETVGEIFNGNNAGKNS